jgi:hypothetical protein
MSSNRLFSDRRAYTLKVAWAEQENEQPVAIEEAPSIGGQPENCASPALRSRPRCGQKALQKTELAPRHLRLIPA